MGLYHIHPSHLASCGNQTVALTSFISSSISQLKNLIWFDYFNRMAEVNCPEEGDAGKELENEMDQIGGGKSLSMFKDWTSCKQQLRMERNTERMSGRNGLNCTADCIRIALPTIRIDFSLPYHIFSQTREPSTFHVIIYGALTGSY